ncbi:hypothetical protein O181_008974 [Austropuccinia psidii MF-1]|uniref:Uncharacterized protein n=1 Tax=Austropuccinia psidii MF-1 TaxID=1389203 RepID=A0A9Q3BNG6_9BASI|nr:hypothetical protein [Austropuccinia psidii MF-1]
MPQPLPRTLGNSTEFNELQTSAPESGSEISVMVSSHELGIEVESLAHESNPDPPVLPQRIRKRPNINATKKTNKNHSTFEGAKDAWDQGDDMINVEVDHIDNEHSHTESTPILNETIHDENPPASPQNIQAFQERETIKHDTMGQDMTDIMPDPEPKVPSSTNFQGIFLSCIEEFG